MTFTSLVPTHYIMMLGLPDAVRARYDVEPVSQADDLVRAGAQGHQARDHGVLPRTRGCSSCTARPRRAGSRCCGPTSRSTKLGSVGREWTGSGPIKLLDSDGNEVPDGEVGELYLAHALHVRRLLETRRRPPRRSAAATAAVGDMARRDEDGFYPSRRPQEQHDHQRRREHLSVARSRTCSGATRREGRRGDRRPGRQVGRGVHAVVVLHDGATRERRRGARVVPRTRSPATSVRARSSFMSEAEMPRTATGKILHRVLRDMLSKPEK